MSDGDSLLRAILADPEDDAPRLVYADWLDEHGDAPRAAFIRAQIELTRLRNGEPAFRQALKVQRDLWKAHKHTWKAWVPKWAQFDAFRRGFLENIRCDAADYVARADELRSRTPLMAVRLDGRGELALPVFRSRALEGLRALMVAIPVPRPVWEYFAECPYLGSLTDLTLSSNGHPAQLVAALLTSPGLPALRRLRLAWCVLGDEHTARLVGHPFAARLRELDLSNNHITAEGARAVAESPHLDGLEYLNLRGNPLAADRLAVEALRQRFGPRVKV